MFCLIQIFFVIRAGYFFGVRVDFATYKDFNVELIIVAVKFMYFMIQICLVIRAEFFFGERVDCVRYMVREVGAFLCLSCRHTVSSRGQRLGPV